MIVVLTYDHPHRKTEDVVYRLMASGNIPTVVATPWVDRKPRRYLYGHRPAEKNWPCEPSRVAPAHIYRNLDIDFFSTKNLEECLRELSASVVVVGGAGILPSEIVDTYKVVNVHPGLLPARRGLDVLKWAIRDCKQVGVTAHLCDERTDLGWHIESRDVPVFPEDTFHSFAMRQYEYELSLIPAATAQAVVMDRDDFSRIEPGETKAFKRMPRVVEAQLPEAFERYKRVFA